MIRDKINLLLYKNSFHVGGAEKQLILLANHLSREKFNVFVLAFEMDENLVKQLTREVKCFKLAARKIISNVLFLRAFFRKNSIHICHAWDFRSSIVGFWATRVHNTRFIDGSLRSAPGKNIKWVGKGAWKQKVKVVFFTLLRIPLVVNSYAGLSSYGINQYAKSTVIYNGLYLKKRKKTGTLNLPGSIKVCMVANMRWKKDFLTFIKAGLRVLEVYPHTFFYLLGNGPDKQKYMDFLKENPFNDNFIFTGFVENVIEYIEKMDICVLCNDISGEGLSNSIMEYMACKKPVIATDMGGNPELIVDNETGFLIKEKDHLELSSKILYLMDRPSEIKRIGEKGYQRLLDVCSIEKMINKYENLYENLVISK